MPKNGSGLLSYGKAVKIFIGVTRKLFPMTGQSGSKSLHFSLEHGGHTPSSFLSLESDGFQCPIRNVTVCAGEKVGSTSVEDQISKKQ